MNDKLSELMSKNSIDDIYKFLDAVPDVYLILDSNREVVYTNKTMKELLSDKPEGFIFGRRPGELLNCRHFVESEHGCGTTETCKTCGAFNAIISSLDGQDAIMECRIEQHGTGDALDFRVWTTPYEVNGKRYSILAMSDISNEKRKEALERIFFHDIMNTATGLRGMAQLVAEYPDDTDEFKELIVNLTDRLVDEINAQRMLVHAENSELQADFELVNSKSLLQNTLDVYRKNYLTKHKELQLDSSTAEVDFHSDKTLLRRVLLNMVKNAIEASPMGSVVTAGCTRNGEVVEFWVHNPSFIPREIQLQIFKRSFSTKGTGRGLGTYSMKLISERYLNGKVSFTSSEENGTVFTATYPIGDGRFRK